MSTKKSTEIKWQKWPSRQRTMNLKETVVWFAKTYMLPNTQSAVNILSAYLHDDDGDDHLMHHLNLVSKRY